MKGRDTAPGWLVERPVAHRGLHDAAAGVVENSPSAAMAAIAQGFAIECDVRATADGEAVVFHDATLERLTERRGPVAALRADALGGIALAGSADRIPTLPAYLALVAGKVPLICEVKSAFDGDMRLAERVAAIARDYAGPFAVKSFDPAVVAHLRGTALPCPLGIVAEARYAATEWPMLSPEMTLRLEAMLHFADSRPDFLSYRIDDLPHAVPFLCRAALGMPVMAWTVRTAEQRQRAALWADQMVFEGFVP